MNTITNKVDLVQAVENELQPEIFDELINLLMLNSEEDISFESFDEDFSITNVREENDLIKFDIKVLAIYDESGSEVKVMVTFECVTKSLNDFKDAKLYYMDMDLLHSFIDDK